MSKHEKARLKVFVEMIENVAEETHDSEAKRELTKILKDIEKSIKE